MLCAILVLNDDIKEASLTFLCPGMLSDNTTGLLDWLLCARQAQRHLLYRVNIKANPSLTFVHMSAMHADFCMKFYTTVKQ